MPISFEQAPIDAAQEPALTPQLHPRWALRADHVLMVAVLGVLFMFANYQPLWNTQLWGHVVYGNWILEHRGLPIEDPVLPLAEGMTMIDTAWLSQVLFAEVERFGGAEGLSHMFAFVVLTIFLTLAWTFYLQTRRLLVAVLGVLAVMAIGWSRFTIIGPESFAALCFVVLIWLIVSTDVTQQLESLNDRARLREGEAPAREGEAPAREGEAPAREGEAPAEPSVRQEPHPPFPSSAVGHLGRDGRKPPAKPWRLYCGLPLLFVVWANLHESFIYGIAVLGCYLFGHLCEVGWRTRSLRGVLTDRAARRWLYLCELSVLVTLVNPYGTDLWLRTIWFTAGVETQRAPLTILGPGGREFALSWVVLLMVLRNSQRRVPVAHGLLIGVFAATTVFRIDIIGWYAVVFGVALVPHLAKLLAPFRPARVHPSGEPSAAAVSTRADQVALPPGRSWRYSLVCLLLIWLVFALSPIGSHIMPGGSVRTPRQLLGESTPVALTEYLRANPPPGQVFHPQRWGDWLVWDGPEGIRAFVTTSNRQIPSQVWRDYVQVTQARSGWQRVLSRYRVQTAIFDKEQQGSQARALRRDEEWRIVYEDSQAIVFRRTGSGPAAGTDQPADINSDEPPRASEQDE